MLRSQGGFIPQWSSSWRLGELSLYADRFSFAQPGRPRVELALATVTDVAMERRKFVLLHKDVVRLTCVLPNQKRPRLVWFITADAGRWFDELVKLTKVGRAAASKRAGASGAADGARTRGRPSGSTMSRSPGGARTAPSSPASGAEPMIVREEQVEELSAVLSPAGGRVLRHLWERRHADIKELARVADSRSHMEVLTLLREGINGAAERLFGRPVVVFKERAVDHASGQAVCFQWWLERADEQGEAATALDARAALDAGTALDARREAGAPWAETDAPVAQADGETPSADSDAPLVEIHDEGDTLMIVVVGPGIGPETVRAPEVADGDALVLVLEPAAAQQELRVSLPCGVQAAPLAATLANGVASITLAKKTQEERR